jgi:hypothetical protein
VEAVHLILRYAHLLGFAVLLGAAVAQYVARPLRINAPMLWGAGLQLVTGAALASPLRPEDAGEPPAAKLIVKLVVAIMIFVMVFFSRRRAEVNSGHFLAIIGLTLVNAAVATFWR